MRSIVIYLLAVAVVCMVTSCSKKSSPAPSSPTTTNYPYYFRFNLNGMTDTIASTGMTKSFADGPSDVLAAVSPDGANLWPSMSIRFALPNWWDTVRESDVMGMVGKTLYFTDSIMRPSITYELSDTNEWVSSWRSSDYVKVDSITFNGTDTYMGKAVRTYTIVGSCQSLMSNYPRPDEFLTGTFRMRLVRETW